MAAGVNYCGLVKMIHKGFCLSTLEKLIKDWTGGSYLVMKSTPTAHVGRPLLDVGYRYNSRKVLGYIATEGAGSTEPGDPYLSCFPNIFSDVSIHPVVCPHLIVRYSNACNAIEIHNSMRQSDLALDKYWVTQSGYFRLETTVALGMVITDGNLLYCRSVSEGNIDRKVSTQDYNNREVYDCFNNNFTDECYGLYLNLPPVIIEETPLLHKISLYNPDLLLGSIYIASENSVSTLTTPSDSTDFLPSDDPNNLHVMKKYEPYFGRLKRGNFCGKLDKKRCYKNTSFYL